MSIVYYSYTYIACRKSHEESNQEHKGSKSIQGKVDNNQNGEKSRRWGVMETKRRNVQKGGYGLLFGIFSKKISKMMTEIQY